MDEIRVNYEALQDAIAKFQSLENGPQYQLNKSSAIFGSSRGATADKIMDVVKQLSEIESVMIEIVQRTKEALVKAGVTFHAAEDESLKSYQ